MRKSISDFAHEIEGLLQDITNTHEQEVSDLEETIRYKNQEIEELKEQISNQ